MTPTLSLIGYFPKRIAIAEPAMALPGVRDIWSVSGCISKDPPDWIQHWRHNECGAFNSRSLALSVVAPADAASYVVLAYRVLAQEFHEHGEVPVVFPSSLPDIALEPGYQSIGFDAVGWSHGTFGCSPLSCNGGAKEFPVNARCLFPALDSAIAGARAFTTGPWEPPPYRVVEVLAHRNDTPDMT